MSPRMWFTLVLRYFGVSEVISGLNSFVTAYNVHLGYFSGSATTGAFVNHGVEGVAIGLVLLLQERLRFLPSWSKRSPKS